MTFTSIKNLLLKNPNITNIILNIVRKTGFDIVSGRNPEFALLSHYGINLIFDVGANIGQYAMRTRALGYRGRIVSFEPISSVFAELALNAKNDPFWTTLNFGLGNYDGEASTNISNCSVYSSLLNALPLLNQNDPKSVYISKERINIHKLDSIFSKYYKDGDNFFLKIDTQGYEKNVLEGADSALKHTTGIQLELSYVAQYQDELLIMEMIDFLLTKGFKPVVLEPLSHNSAFGSILQANGMFFRLN